MSQGYQSEFLTYVKRTGSLPPSPARTTSRYGRPLGTSTFDRRSGFVEFAPAARKFPDNSPLNEDGTWKVTPPRDPTTKDEGDAKTPPEPQQSPTSSPTEKTEAQVFSVAGFTSNSFYRNGKEGKMKDRDPEEGLTTETTDTAEMEAERRSRRGSPAASLTIEGKSPRAKSTSPSLSESARELHNSVAQQNGNTECHDDVPSAEQQDKEEEEEEAKSSDKKLDDKDNLSQPAARPKRNIIPKSMKEMGLSWREENDLKKALYASLQETKRSGEECSENGSTPCSDKSDRKKEHRTYNKSWSNSEMDESSQESSKSYLSTETNNSESKLSSMLKVRAQRKFAVGSRPGSPGTTPVKNKNSPRKFFTTKKAKTEDFLTFLCLRGSHMLPPHLDFSKCEDSDDCFPNSCPNTPKSSRPSTPALAGITARDLTPRGGRGAPTSRSTTPDKDINLEDTDLGVKPLPNDAQSPTNSPSKKSHNKPTTPSQSPNKSHNKPTTPSPSPNKSHNTAKRKSTSEQTSPSEKKTKLRDKDKERGTSSPSKKNKEKEKLKKKKKSQGGRSTLEGKVKKKKKKRKEEAKMLRRKLVLRACNTAVKASKRKLRLAENSKNSSAENGHPIESITSILEGLTSRRVIARLRGPDTPQKKDKSKESPEKKKAEVTAPLTRTRSPETRSTRSHPRAPSPSRPHPRPESGSPPPQRTPTKDTPDNSPQKSSSKKRNSSSKKKDRLLKKKTRSESRLQSLHRSNDKPAVTVPESPVHEPVHRTRSLPLLPSATPVREPVREPVQVSPGGVKRAVTPVPKTTKKATTPTPGPAPATSGTNNVEKKARGRPPGSGKKASNPISTLKLSFRAPFPSPQDPGQVVDIPTYHPSSEQFQDPISYIQLIRADAEPFGMCRIVPPDGWKPECKFPDDLKFMTQMQYIHRMWDRWAPNALTLECIRRHLKSQGIKLEQAPMVGGVELDLPALSETLQVFGGMQSVIDKNKWPKVIESLKIPKMAPERCSKLYDAYCKYLLSYDTLPDDEKQNLLLAVLADKDKNQLDNDECVAKGRIRHLSDFFRHSRNIESVWFTKDEPSHEEVEALYWQILSEGKRHVAVQRAEVDTKVCGSGFPTKKDSPYSRHGWNLNILQHNSGSMLRCLGAVSGVTVPVLHVGMMFTTKCWSANDHLLPQIIYKHTGADTVWYCLPASEESKFHAVCKDLVPEHADDDPVWLLDDTVMISPQQLTDHGVSLGRTTLSPGQFLIVFPEAFTASVSCGYNLCESIHFATPDWIPLGSKAAQMLHDSGVPEQFSMDRLLFKLARYEKTTNEVLEFVLPQLESVIEREVRDRQELEDSGLHASERMCLYDDDVMPSNKKRHRYDQPEPEDNICDVSKKICYLSMVLNEADDTVFSLEHAMPHIQKKRNLKVCKLLYRYSIDEMNKILSVVKARLAGEEVDAYNPPVKKKAVK